MTQISATALSALTSRGTRTEAATAAAAHELEGGDIRSAFEDLYGRDSTAGPRPLDEIAQTVMAAQAATAPAPEEPAASPAPEAPPAPAVGVPMSSVIANIRERVDEAMSREDADAALQGFMTTRQDTEAVDARLARASAESLFAARISS